VVREQKRAVGSRFMSTQKDIIVVFSTTPSDKSAELARLLVEKRVVACVNVVPVHSYYHWNGGFCSEPEHLLIAKTTKKKAQEVIATIKSNHPYEVPEIIALPVFDGYLPYLEWVHKETLDEP
jgi:periplasmic divalent cation tolerance protein